MRHRYNGAGERVAIVYPDGKTLEIRREDDRDGRIQFGRALGLRWADAAGELVDRVSYEARGLLTGYRAYGHQTTITRDERRRVSSLRVVDAAGQERVLRKRRYDDRGKVTQLVVDGQTYKVDHDVLER